MKQRLPLALSVAAFAVAVFGATSVGTAAVHTLAKAKTVAFAKRAGFAKKAGLANKAKVATRANTATTAGTAGDANSVNGIHASTTPTAGQLFPLGSDGMFPSSVIPTSGTPSGVWKLTGNATQSGDFLGTTNDQLLDIRTNDLRRMIIDTSGNVGIGNSGPGARLEVTPAAGDIGIMGTADSRAVLGRLGPISCPGTFGVGGCAGATGASGVVGRSDSGIGVQGSSLTGRAVQGFSTSGIGVIGDSTTRGVIGTLGQSSCPGVYGVGACGGTADGLVARTAAPANSATAAAVHAFNSAGGDIFIGESGSARVVRIDGTGKGFFDGGTQTGGADYAESIPAVQSQSLQPGDVLAVRSGNGFTVGKARSAGSPLVVGVYSTKPAVLAVGNRGVNASLAGTVPVAMLGVVPTKVSAENGAIRPGDLLTTARTPGYAMKARALVVHGVRLYGSGTILGKALQPLSHGSGVIRVLPMLR